MKYTPSKINLFLLYKLPAAYFTGVRVTELNDTNATVKVKHSWINQNPFKSLYWAVQGMASELTTGMLMMKQINDCKEPISMLVAHQSGRFTKKAVGKITFTCDEGDKVALAIQQAIQTKEGQLLTLNSIGVDEVGDEVSNFSYEWTIKLKQPKT